MRPIDADELWNKCKTLKINTPLDRLFALRKIATWIKEAPTVDTERHGHWVKDKNNYVYHYICSACGEADEHKSNYCRHCGAKMDKGVN